MPIIEQLIPEGTYQSFHQGEIRPVTFKTYEGRWVILVFYPGDFTFVCPTELADLKRLYPEFHKLNAEVLGISTDSVYVHKAWHDVSPAVKGVPFPLVSDAGGRLAQRLGVYVAQEGVAHRGTFIYDPDGKLCAYEVHNNSIGRNMDELLRKVQAAVFVRQNGGIEVCPSGWAPGEKTLKPGLDLVGTI
jgi:NADH-dependent peroxiredoxin subunit C